MKKFSLIVMVLILSGCATNKGLVKFEQFNIKNLEINQVESRSKKILILRDKPTRAGVLAVLINWCNENDIEVAVVELMSDARPEDYVLTYRASWGWDIGVYMRKVDMSVISNDKTLGTLRFDALQYGAFGKFGSGEKRLKILLDALFGKISREKANKLLGES